MTAGWRKTSALINGGAFFWWGLSLKSKKRPVKNYKKKIKGWG